MPAKILSILGHPNDACVKEHSIEQPDMEQTVSH